MKRYLGGPAMRISWNRRMTATESSEWPSDWASAAGELEGGLPLHTGRALTWLSASQAVIQLSGLLFIIYACLQ